MIKNFAALALSMLVCFSALGGADAAGADAAAADAAAAADSIDYDTKFGALTDKDKKRALKAVGREVNKVLPICNEPKVYDLHEK